ncbi:MAG: cell division protein FtsA [Candidatus Mycalebacterium zealandia]|nr:MAG: cell division protein FtsA [Candidatus Mycalebacterium zealandia]
MSSEKPEIFIGLDLGTTKICAIVAQVNGRDINIIGFGMHPSTGLRRGIVVDVEKTTDCIASAIEKAEEMSGQEIRSAFVGIAGGHIKSHIAHGVVNITDGRVTDGDMRRLIESATAKNVTADREIIHAVPGKYSIDGKDSVINPLGMHGSKIETEVHIVTGQVTDTNTLVRCVREASMDVNGIVLEQIASAAAVLNDADKDLGVVLVDCGGGTTDIAVFNRGGLKYTQNITLGGDHIDRDISHRFNTVSDLESRRIKESHGVAFERLASECKNVTVRCSDNTEQKVSRREIAKIIEPRMREILSFAKEEIPDSVEIYGPSSKVILTGGTFVMEGAVEMASEIFDMPARLGVPCGVVSNTEAILSPAYSTGIGLIHYGVKYSEKSDKIRVRGGKTPFNKILGWMEQWFNEFF